MRWSVGSAAHLYANILAVDPTELAQALHEGRQLRLACRLYRSPVHEHADAPHSVALLRPRRYRQRRRAPEPRDELSPSDH